MCRRCHALQHNLFFIPCRELAAKPIPTCKEYRVMRSGDESIHQHYMTTHIHTPRCPWKSSLLLTRATSSCFPKHWSVEALKSRDLLKTLLCITLTNNLYFHNRSIFFIYRTFSLALLKWSKAQGLIKTPKTFTDGFWKASSGHKPPCRNVKKAMLQSMQQQRWENTTDETNVDKCVHSTKP